MNKTAMGAFTAASAFGSMWGAYLVQLHQQAVAQTLEPGMLCGADGGCHTVLASEWSTVGGVAVSAPAFGLFGALAVLGALALAGKVDAGRVSVLGVASALVGVVFGGFLIVQMSALGLVCNYCLVMDAATVAVGVTAFLAHPEGSAGVLAGLKALPGRASESGIEWGLPGGVFVGVLAMMAFFPEPKEVAAGPVEVVMADAATPRAPVAPTGGAAEKTGETKRVVIPAEVKTIAIGPDVPTVGPADAPITIALFEDFQCPFCRKLAGNMAALQAERSDQVRVAFFHFPMNLDCTAATMEKSLHPDACGAASAGVCANQQGKFWPMHDVLFQNNGRLGRRDLTGYARELGLDMGAFAACMQDPKTLDVVRAQSEVGAKAGVSGTPSFFVNGRMLSGAQPPEALRAIVDAIAKAPTDRVLLDVETEGEVLGDVPAGAPSVVTLQGPRGPFSIFAFEASIEGGKAVSKPGVEPARGVSYFQAKAACEAVGQRLCAEDEWLTACTGTLPVDDDNSGLFSDDKVDGRAQPYGAYPQQTWCAAYRDRNDEKPLLTGNHPRCVTPEGVYDLEGVTKEWIGLSPDKAGLKGGSYFSRESARCGYFKDTIPPDTEDRSNGFRCCSGPAPTAADHHPGGKVGDNIHDFSLPLAKGGTLTRSQVAGKAYVMTFWASWCGPCRAELPALAEMYEKYKDQGFTVIAVNVDAEEPKAHGFLKQFPLPFLIAMDTRSTFQATMDTRELPTAFWVTKSGMIRQRTIGYDEKARPELEANVQALIATP